MINMTIFNVLPYTMRYNVNVNRKLDLISFQNRSLIIELLVKMSISKKKIVIRSKHYKAIVIYGFLPSLLRCQLVDSDRRPYVAILQITTIFVFLAREGASSWRNFRLVEKRMGTTVPVALEARGRDPLFESTPLLIFPPITNNANNRVSVPTRKKVRTMKRRPSAIEITKLRNMLEGTTVVKDHSARLSRVLKM